MLLSSILSMCILSLCFVLKKIRKPFIVEYIGIVSFIFSFFGGVGGGHTKQVILFLYLFCLL